MKSVLDQSMRKQKGWLGVYMIMKRRIRSRHALSLRFVNKDIRVVQKDCFDCLQNQNSYQLALRRARSAVKGRTWF